MNKDEDIDNLIEELLAIEEKYQSLIDCKNFSAMILGRGMVLTLRYAETKEEADKHINSIIKQVKEGYEKLYGNRG